MMRKWLIFHRTLLEMNIHTASCGSTRSWIYVGVIAPRGDNPDGVRKCNILLFLLFFIAPGCDYPDGCDDPHDCGSPRAKPWGLRNANRRRRNNFFSWIPWDSTRVLAQQFFYGRILGSFPFGSLMNNECTFFKKSIPMAPALQNHLLWLRLIYFWPPQTRAFSYCQVLVSARHLPQYWRGSALIFSRA